MEKAAKTQKVKVPFPLTDADKADALDRLLELKEQLSVKEAEKSDYIKEFNEESKTINNKMDYEFSLVKKGIREEEMELRVRKNFQVQPPMLQYVDLKDDNEVVHEVELPGEEYQLAPSDWVIDEKGKSSIVPEMETLPEDSDE